MKSLFRCTVCGAALTREEKNYRCPNGHCFDIAKEGYTYLLPVNQRHSKSPGDDKAMTAARSAFLNKGYYEFLRSALCDIALTYTRHAPAVLDVGCGDGYYTSAIWSILANTGKEPRSLICFFFLNLSLPIDHQPELQAELLRRLPAKNHPP